MTTDNRFMIKALQKLDVFYAVTSRGTNLPYAECDSETFDDQTYIFSKEEDARAFCTKLDKDGYPAVPAAITREDMSNYYTGLYLTGINRLVFHNGAGYSYLPLDQVVSLKKPEQKDNMPPVMNSALQLTCIYFLQELRRPGQEEKNPERIAKLRELEQEIMADLFRSRFIAVVDITDVKGKLDLSKPDPDIKVPFLKTPSGEILQPIFSDLWEFEKFRSKSTRKLQLLTLPFQSLASTLVPNAKGYALNPSGFNLVLQKDKVNALIQQRQ